MHLTSTDRILAGLAAVFFCYQLVSALNSGIYRDPDRDVDAARNPVAFALTAVTAIGLIALCAFIALAPGSAEFSAALSWLHQSGWW